MKKISLMLVVMVSSLFLAGCGATAIKTTPPAKSPPKSAVPAAAQKTGTTTKTGVISNQGGKFFIQVAGKQPEEIDSYTVDLNSYVGQTVTVEGQFSGNTLFVGVVK